MSISFKGANRWLLLMSMIIASIIISDPQIPLSEGGNLELKTCSRFLASPDRERRTTATAMAFRTGDLDRLSGVELPLILQKKLKGQQKAPGEQATENEPDDENAECVFTAEELEERVLRARAAISDIQKQLIIGEESYHEETNAHGNLFRGGWELFIDVKDSAPSGHKRMPADYRWFSGSYVGTAGRNQGRSISMKSLSLLPSAKKGVPVARSASQASIPSAASSVSQGGSGNAVSTGTKGNVEASGVESTPHGAQATQVMPRPANASSTGAISSSAKDATSKQGQNPSNATEKKADFATAPAAALPPKEGSSGRKGRKRKASE